MISITKELNRTRVPVFGRSKVGWNPAYVQKILDSRTVIGDLVSTVRRDGKREELAPIENHYPPVVNREVFGAVRRLRMTRKSYRGKSTVNPFTGLAFDRATGAKMRYVTKGNPAHHYLVNRLAISGMAPYVSWRYDQFLALFPTMCKRVKDGVAVIEADAR